MSNLTERTPVAVSIEVFNSRKTVIKAEHALNCFSGKSRSIFEISQ